MKCPGLHAPAATRLKRRFFSIAGAKAASTARTSRTRHIHSLPNACLGFHFLQHILMCRHLLSPSLTKIRTQSTDDNAHETTLRNLSYRVLLISGVLWQVIVCTPSKRPFAIGHIDKGTIRMCRTSRSVPERAMEVYPTVGELEQGLDRSRSEAG